MEDGKDAQWSVNMYLHVKTCLDYLWRGLDASLVSEGNLGLGGGGGAMRLQQAQQARTAFWGPEELAQHRATRDQAPN